MLNKEEIKELYYQDLRIHSISFAKWISKNGYEKVFKPNKGWVDVFVEENHFFDTAKRHTIKELYNQFMIETLC